MSVCERAEDPNNGSTNPYDSDDSTQAIVRTKAKLNVKKTFDMLRSRRVQMHTFTIKEMIMGEAADSETIDKTREEKMIEEET